MQTVAAGNAGREAALRACVRAFGATPTSTDKCLHSCTPALLSHTITL